MKWKITDYELHSHKLCFGLYRTTISLKGIKKGTYPANFLMLGKMWSNNPPTKPDKFVSSAICCKRHQN